MVVVGEVGEVKGEVKGEEDEEDEEDEGEWWLEERDIVGLCCPYFILLSSVCLLSVFCPSSVRPCPVLVYTALRLRHLRAAERQRTDSGRTADGQSEVAKLPGSRLPDDDKGRTKEETELS